MWVQLVLLCRHDLLQRQQLLQRLRGVPAGRVPPQGLGGVRRPRVRPGPGLRAGPGERAAPCAALRSHVLRSVAVAVHTSALGPSACPTAWYGMTRTLRLPHARRFPPTLLQCCAAGASVCGGRCCDGASLCLNSQCVPAGSSLCSGTICPPGYFCAGSTTCCPNVSVFKGAASTGCCALRLAERPAVVLLRHALHPDAPPPTTAAPPLSGPDRLQRQVLPERHLVPAGLVRAPGFPDVSM